MIVSVKYVNGADTELRGPRGISGTSANVNVRQDPKQAAQGHPFRLSSEHSDDHGRYHCLHLSEVGIVDS